MTNITEDLSYTDLNESYYMDYEISSFDDQTPLYTIIIITVIYAFIFVVGLIGNVVTCIVIACNKSMRTTTNCYLFNLAISDLLLLIAGVPSQIYNVWNPNKYFGGSSGCFLHFWISELPILASNLTVAAFTVERYLAICRPFLVQIMSQKSRTTKIIAGLWIVSTLSALMLASKSHLVFLGKTKPTCAYFREEIPYYLETGMIIFYVIPMTIIVILYVLIGMRVVKSSRMQKARGDKRKDTNKIDSGTKKVLKMLVAVVVAYFICWTPFHVQRMFAMYAPTFIDEANWQKYQMLDSALFYISEILCFFSAAINPIIYSTMSSKFRTAFKQILPKSYDMFRQINLSRLPSANINNKNFEAADTLL